VTVPPRAADRWRRLDVTVRDLPLALVLALASLVPFLNAYGTQVGELPARPFDAAAVLVVALECLPLAVRRRWPAATIALVSLGFAAQQLAGHQLFAGNALAVALVSTGLHLERGRRVTAGVLTAAYAALVVALRLLGSTESVGSSVTFYLALVLAWGIGAWLRSARSAEAAERRRVAETTRAAERTRIARDLHDVVTHHVTAMVVQAEAARYLTAAPERLDEALDAVSDTGRRAVADLRQLLDVLDPEHDAPLRGPAVADLHALVEQTRRAGQPVELVEEGIGPVADDVVVLTVFRVVQESLTNALKHAHGSATTVVVRRRADETVVEVSTEDPGTTARYPSGVVPPGGGRGLAGLRERVTPLGGTLDAGPGPDGGFVVRAHIPSPARPGARP
jgi:signal transduction histidine kinase